MTKILLVEDDKSLREIYGVRLLAEGYDIVSAGDGEEALAMAIKDRPALIVSDVMMPKISGFDMLDILRSTTETRNIRVIMMTALSSDDQRKRGEELGADRYLVKSQVGIEDVVRAVHEVLADAPTSAPSPNQFSSSAPNTPQANVPAQPQPNPMQRTDSVPIPPREIPPVYQTTPPPTSTPPVVIATPQAVAAAPSTPQQPQQEPATSSTPPPIADSSLQRPPSDLPQPTAPFSSPRPGNLASRVIEPLSNTDPDAPAVSDLMEKELQDHAAAQAQPAEPVMPVIPPAPVQLPSSPIMAPPPPPIVTSIPISQTPQQTFQQPNQSTDQTPQQQFIETPSVAQPAQPISTEPNFSTPFAHPSAPTAQSSQQ